MKREDLKKIEGLTDEQINSIMGLHQSDMNSWTSKFNDQNAQIKAERDKVTSLTAEVDKYKDVDLEELKNAKTQYENEKQKLIEDHAKEVSDLQFNSALEIAVLGTKTVDPIALKAHLDTSKLKYNQETKTVEGFDDQLKAIKASRSYLFDSSATGGSHGGLKGDTDNVLNLNGALSEYYKD